MTKGRAKNKSSVGEDILAPPQSRSLRSRKRECPSEAIPEPDGAHAALHHQHQHAAERSHLTKQDMATEEKLAEGDHVSLNNVSVKATEEQEETVTKPSRDCQVMITEDKADESGMNKEETRAVECNGSPQTRIDLLQVPLPTSEESDGCCSNASDDQLGARESSQCNLERNQETSLEDMEVKEVTKEAAVGLPAKKKRRMGMCGLTEKERSHFLKVQNEKNGVVQKQMCDKTAEDVTQDKEISKTPLSPSPLSTPAGGITGQSEPEIKVQSSHCGGDGGSESFSEESKITWAETEVHVLAVPVLAGTSTACDPGCSEEKEVEEGIVAAPEETGDTQSDPPAEPECLRNEERQEPEERTTETLGAKSQEQIKELEDKAAEVHQSPAIGSCTIATQDKESEDGDSVAARMMEVNSVTRSTDEKTEELTGDAEGIDGAEADVSPTKVPSEGFTCAAEGLCEAAVTLSGSERKDTCDPDGGTDGGASTVNAEHPQTRAGTDPFGSGCLDYVSDSQLNTIVLTEEEVMEVQEDVGSPHSHEDATDLICGLIRELSSLNRRVMATHREIENLHRGSKSSRSSIR